MQLEIGSKTYDFALAPELPTDDGMGRAAVCDHRQRRILISASVPPAIRAEVVALAVSEAWKRELIQRPPIKFVGDVG